MGRTKLYIDYDGTIVDSVSAICRTYNALYQHHPDFKPAKPEEVKTWSMKEIIPLCQNVEELFDCHLFFKYVEFMPNAKEVLLELNEKYDIHILTIGNLLNIAQKAIWIKDNLPFIKNVKFHYNHGCEPNKDEIRMDGGIIIDDNQKNLTNPTASLPIVFGKKFEWNSDFMGIRCETWDDVKKLLLD
jgi:5'(3')-deoxyribonucleotidase